VFTNLLFERDVKALNNHLFQVKGDRPLDDIIAEHASKLQKKSLLFSTSNTQLSSLQKVSQDFLSKSLCFRSGV